MDFQVGAEAPLTPNIEEHATALTALESAAQEIHKSLNSILDYQTHHRLVRLDQSSLTFPIKSNVLHLFKNN